ncbi:MAG: hypothetical protein ACTS5F_00185 [Candidatus Hodgkinia cicadicola]
MRSEEVDSTVNQWNNESTRSEMKWKKGRNNPSNGLTAEWKLVNSSNEASADVVYLLSRNHRP